MLLKMAWNSRHGDEISAETWKIQSSLADTEGVEAGGAPYLGTNYTWSKKREEEEVKKQTNHSQIPAKKKTTQDAPLQEQSRDGHGFTWRLTPGELFLFITNWRPGHI